MTMLKYTFEFAEPVSLEQTVVRNYGEKYINLFLELFICRHVINFIQINCFVQPQANPNSG
jgi:hypothetical protein